ncbi:MAG: PqqD family protein [Chloroflexota bacterium]
MQVLKQTLRANESVVSADLDGETVLLNVETGVYFGLDPVGTEIWKVLEKGATEDEVVVRLGEIFEVDADQLREDVRDFVIQLQDKQLVLNEP